MTAILHTAPCGCTVARENGGGVQRLRVRSL